MPISKYKHVADIPPPKRYASDDPKLLQAIEELWQFSDSIANLKFPPGVYKHKNVEQAYAQRLEWERRSVQM
jgi:hypothetical protein